MIKSHRAAKQNLNLLLPPAAGFRLPLLVKLISSNKVLPKYYFRALIIFIFNIINAPFRWYEKRFINPRISRSAIPEAPIFIIGHWRSGTTYLHNLLCQDPQMGYVTTYQGVFPDTMFNWLGKFIFKNFMALLIPPTRKGDNVKLAPDFPQEEDFILGMVNPLCFYYFWMFPKNIKEYYKKYIQFDGISRELINEWNSEYQLLIKKALKNTNTRCFVSKNPPNTGRIKQLLEIFPDARFIHIHRHPVTVFLSTRHFFSKMLPFLQFQSITDEELEENILFVYREIMTQMIRDIPLIPEKNFIEIRFDDLEDDPLKEIERIYDKFGIPEKETALSEMKLYLSDSKDYQKNKLHLNKAQLKKILKVCQFSMEKWGYSPPDNTELIDNY
jgi:hypothetical protein